MSLNVRNKGFVVLTVVSLIMIFTSITMMMLIMNKSKSDVIIEESNILTEKIELEQFALNVVGNVNVKNMVSETFKNRNNFQYKIKKYLDNYIVYIRKKDNQELIYYMIFNNYQTNKNLIKTTIYQEGYLRGENTELES